MKLLNYRSYMFLFTDTLSHSAHSFLTQLSRRHVASCQIRNTAPCPRMFYSHGSTKVDSPSWVCTYVLCQNYSAIGNRHTVFFNMPLINYLDLSHRELLCNDIYNMIEKLFITYTQHRYPMCLLNITKVNIWNCTAISLIIAM